MNSDLHERARMLIALSGPEGLAEQLWLAAHLESCPACRQFADNTSEAIASLRMVSVAAGAGLVLATQLRVRQRALELQRRQERMWIVAVLCGSNGMYCRDDFFALVWIRVVRRMGTA
jgi:predicted anti-sigma-YlaC factor YlaD